MDYVDGKATDPLLCRYVWLIELHLVVPCTHLPLAHSLPSVG